MFQLLHISARICVVFAITALMSQPIPSSIKPNPESSMTATGLDDTTTVQTDVESHAARLRKLHLVRPDLIPYPIAYEIYC